MQPNSTISRIWDKTNNNHTAANIAKTHAYRDDLKDIKQHHQPIITSATKPNHTPPKPKTSSAEQSIEGPRRSSP